MALPAPDSACLLALAVLAAECAVLAGLALRRGARAAALDVVIAALPGAMLVMALYAALRQAAGSVVLACLAASLPAHAADLWRRHRRASQPN